MRSASQTAAVIDLTAELAEAYSATGSRWARGPERIYNRLAEVLVSASPLPLSGRLVVDAGAGTGAASRAIARAGGRPVAVDVARGMLTASGLGGVPRSVADVRRLPLRDASVGAVVAAFSYNHLRDPQAGLAEARRVTERGGVVIAASYAADDSHLVRVAVEQAALEAGWRPDPWIDEMRHHALPLLADVCSARAAATDAGLVEVTAERVDVAFPELGPVELVEWRLGMPQLAPFIGGLDDDRRSSIVDRALVLLGACPALVRRLIVLSGHVDR